MRSQYSLFENERGSVPQADYLNPETRQESVCRLWAGFALASVVLAFTAVSLFTPAPEPETAGASFVTPAQANRTEASVTPSQVDLRIAHALGTLENRLVVLEKNTMPESFHAALHYAQDWNAFSNALELPVIDGVKQAPAPSSPTALQTQGTAEQRESAEKAPLQQPASQHKKSHQAEDQEGISILSQMVKTEDIRNVPHHFLPLPKTPAQE